MFTYEMVSFRMVRAIKLRLNIKHFQFSGPHCYYACHQFLSIWYWSNIEYWTRTSKQNDNIHSIKLDVYAMKQSAQNLFHFFPTQAR